MTRAPLLLLVVALVAGLAWWLLEADGDEGTGAGAVVRLEPRVGTSDGSLRPDDLPAAPAPVATALEVDSGAARLAAMADEARRQSTRRRRLVPARLVWDDGAPLAGALVDLAVGPFRTVHGKLEVKDPPAARSDAQGLLRLVGLFAGQPHLAIVQHADLVAPAGVSFEAPAADDRSDGLLELVVPRPATLVVEGLDPLRPLPVVIQDVPSGTVLLRRTPRLPDEAASMTFEGLPRHQAVRVSVQNESGGETAWAESSLGSTRELVRVDSTVAGEEGGTPLSWRLVDARGEPLTTTRLQDQGLPDTPELWIRGSRGRRRTVPLEATGMAFEGVVMMQEQPPWTLEVQLAGRRSRLEGVGPEQLAELTLPDGLLPPVDRLVQLHFQGQDAGLGQVVLIDDEGRHRDASRTTVGRGGRDDRLISVPPGRYAWIARSQDRTAGAHGRLAVFGSEAGSIRRVPVTFGAPGRFEGRVRFVGIDPPRWGSLTLVPTDRRLSPQQVGSGLGSDSAVAIEHLTPGSYRASVSFTWEGKQVSVDVGALEILAGLTTRQDLTVPVDLDPRLRELAVLSRRGEMARLVFSAPDGRQQAHTVWWRGLSDRLREGARPEDLGAEVDPSGDTDPARLLDGLLLRDAPRLLVPPGFDRYEAWIQDGAGWWSSSGRLDLESGLLDLDPAGR